MNIGNFKAERLTHEKLESTLEFCDSYLGKGLYCINDLEKIINRAHHYFYIVYDKTQIAGIFYCFADTAKEAGCYITKDILNTSCEDDWIGVCRSIALTKQYRHLGIAEQLLNYFSDILKFNENVSKIYVLAWVKKDIVPAQKHLQACGYKAIELIKNPWHEYKKLICPVCHEAYCKCNGVLFCKSFKGEI